MRSLSRYNKIEIRGFLQRVILMHKKVFYLDSFINLPSLCYAWKYIKYFSTNLISISIILNSSNIFVFDSRFTLCNLHISASSNCLACYFTNYLACNPNQFKCKEAQCVYSIYWCDGKRDCPGGDDEISGCENCIYNN